jgi:phosphoribosyl 1,2-cyclic phosphodiesterase
MVRFTVLASGSKGNSTVVTGGRTRILVDAGLSCRELLRRMKLADENPATLDAIVVTHEHQDHVNGLAVIARRLGIPVYFTEATHRAWMRWLMPRRQMTYAQWLEQRRQAAERPDGVLRDGELGDGKLETIHATAATKATEAPSIQADTVGTGLAGTVSAGTCSIDGNAVKLAPVKPAPVKEDPAWLPAVEYFQAGQPFAIGDLDVSPFTIPHDAADPVGFVFRSQGVRMAFATDLGYLTPNVKAQLKGVDLLLLESNHDLEMLRDGPYPWSVKQRVLSRVGHLSNEAAADFLANGYDGQAAYVILAHLSENNNLPELARVAAERALEGRPSLLTNRLVVAAQHEPLSPIHF